MAIPKEVWLGMVENNLFDDTLAKVQMGIKDDSAFVAAGGSVVHIPNAGTAATVTKSNDTYPVAVTKRTDNDNYYSLTNFEVGPVLVSWKDGKSASYEQTESILVDQLSGLGVRLGREILLGQYHYTSGLYVPTTGGNATAHSPSATGNRKVLLGADIRTALGIMDRTSVPTGDRYLYVDSTMYWQLMTDLGYTAYRTDLAILGQTGMTDNILGIKIIMMPQVLHSVVSTGAIRAIDHAGATTDQAVALLVQKSCTSMAISEINGFADDSRAEYFGDLYSASVYGGGKYRRYDKYGVVPIIQAT